jgi:hypothetical protein
VTAPGWYPDPSGVQGQRYLDGTDWTEDRWRVSKSSLPVWATWATWIAVLSLIVVPFAAFAVWSVTEALRPVASAHR